MKQTQKNTAHKKSTPELYKALLFKMLEQMEEEKERKEKDVLLKKLKDLIKDKEIVISNSLGRIV